uniref:EF-hand domain-containing protein n=1 Tax=Vannella robusta TaxID=1487602 RepID=A0A6U1WIH6_9EUKA|mmetsp:Transcript_4021/g.4990  ORF Transcript_4021/g.4990 Transcript_4021/m.4990 type:complete len:179 (+) Transcript_4021:719-1255(+)
MGANTSDLRVEEIDELSQETHLRKSEIVRLYQRFKRLDKEGYGTISTDAFLSVPELSMNPLVMRVIRVFDVNNDDNVNFRQFAKTLAVLSKNAPSEQKMELVFKVLDLDNDGFITQQDIEQVLKMMIGSQIISPHDLERIAAETVREYDSTGDGKITFAEFKDVLGDVDWDQKLTIEF